MVAAYSGRPAADAYENDEEAMTHTIFSDADIAFADTAGVGEVMADFAAAARHAADLPAIVHNGRAITYRELAARVCRTASRYRRRRSAVERPDALIGALVSPTPTVAEHLLAMLQSGETYCPIDAALPAGRKMALAAALGVDRLVTLAPEHCGVTNLRLPVLDEAPVARGDLSWEQDHPAYILCTSGSTGAPKPVVISQHALAVTVRMLRRLFALTPNDRVLQFASLGWDTCLEEMLPALTAGAAVVFDDAAHSGSFPRFVRMVAERGITVLDLPTAFWHELVLFLHEERETLPDCVRLVVIGGERVDPTRLRQWRNLDTGQVMLLNTYGCTETTMVTHAVRLSGPGTERGVAAHEGEVPLGRALAHVRDHVSDDGELLVAGPNLATGYLGLPELTAIGFPVADYGFGPTRWFRTGDVVVRRDAGLLYPRGRRDDQVKVLGVRVHPAEVEAQLQTHPAVAGAVVVGERRLGHMTLCAYVVAAAGTTSAELRRHLRERLPAQFVPSRVQFVAALSYTSSGKIDRAATRQAATDCHSGGVSR